MTTSQCLFYIWYLPAHIVEISRTVELQVSAVITTLRWGCCWEQTRGSDHGVRPGPSFSARNAPTRWDGPAGAGGGGVGDGAGHSSGSQALCGHLVEVSGRMKPQTVSLRCCEFQLESFRKQQRGDRHRKQQKTNHQYVYRRGNSSSKRSVYNNSALLCCSCLPLIVHLQAGFTLRQLSAQGLPALHLPLELSLQPDVLLPHLSLLFDVLSSLLRVCRRKKRGKDRWGHQIWHTNTKG